MLSRAALVALAASACGGAGAAPSSSSSSSSSSTGAGCPAGDAVVQVDGEAAALAACAELAGDLTLGPSFTLTTATGVGGLRRVRGTVDVSDNLQLGGVYFAGLVSIGGDLVIETNRQLETASLHHLVEIGGDLVVRGNRRLQRLDLGALRRVGGRVQISGHPNLEAVELGSLEQAGSLAVDDNPAWPADEVEALEQRVRTRDRGAVDGDHADRDR